MTSSVVWMRTADAPASGRAEVDPNATLAAFTEQHRAHSDVRIDQLYAGRLELVDPRLALPTWHKHAREEAAHLHAAIAHCPPAATEPSDPALAKAWAWHARTCDHPPDDLPELDAPPFMHPSGKSYAALALTKGPRAIPWIRAHAGAFHVLELAALAPEALSSEQRALSRLTEHGWQAMLRGDALVLDTGLLLFAGAALPTTRMEFDLLALLLEHPGRVFSREELLNRVWGYERTPTTRTVDTHVVQLRNKLKAELIESVRGVGYRMPKQLET